MCGLLKVNPIFSRLNEVIFRKKTPMEGSIGTIKEFKILQRKGSKFPCHVIFDNGVVSKCRLTAGLIDDIFVQEKFKFTTKVSGKGLFDSRMSKTRPAGNNVRQIDKLIKDIYRKGRHVKDI